ncbi:MAG: hypothetical protein KDC28_15430 [Saprospiraceae bacterium]|nr:hypothetical protein [Saprospiraceae bacterium]MCB9317811.1 hypothetical protein [Lewinellaceae bacterium]
MLTIRTRLGLWLLLLMGVQQVGVAGHLPTDDPVAPAISSLMEVCQHEEISDYLDHWAQRKLKYRDQVAFLRTFFYKTHRKYLKQYVPYSSVQQTLSVGAYDCVSGTALFATFLQALNVPFEIRETGYHVFVIAKLDDKFILLESTDPSAGFVEDQQAIIHQVQQYIFDGLDAAMVSRPIHNTITLEQLEGLMFYNRALDYFQHHDREMAAFYLDYALARYDSPRIRAMSDLLKEHPEQVVIMDR